MSRQLNPGLFGDSNPSPSVSSSSTENFAFYDDSSFMLAEFETFKKEFEKLKFDFQDSGKTSNLKNDKIFQRLQLFEERLNMIQKETHEKWTDLSSKHRDRGMNDAKIEALIERHNQIVQSFELRITQAQRLIDNQTTQLSKQQQMIDDARRQIERLKKLQSSKKRPHCLKNHKFAPF